MLKTTAWTTLVALACAVWAPAFASADSPKNVDIAAGELTTALRTLADQCGAEFVYSADQLKGVHTQGVHGRYTTTNAVDKLLEDTNFAVTVHESGAILIAPLKLDAVGAPSGAAAPRAESSQSAQGATEVKAGRSFLDRFRVAQLDSPRTATADAAVAPTAATAPAESPVEVVVTGSRIVRNGNDAPTPVTVANVEEMAVATPSNIPDALNKLPEFSASRNPATLGNGANPGQGNYLNLRAFGINRTLILLDGRRVPPTSFDGTVNTDTLPQLLVQRVEVVTGGASAVYGSDAVTGVVNYVLDDEFKGLKALAQYGVSSHSDDRSWRVGVAAGTDVGARGHFIFSAEHYDSKGIPSKYDRPYGAGIYQEAGAGTAASPFHTVINGRLSNTSFGGLIVQPTGTPRPFTVPAALAGMQFLPGSVLAPFNAGAATGTTNLSSGGDGGYVVGNAAVAPLVSNQVFGRFQYDFTDSLKGFAQISWANSRNAYNGQNESRPYGGTNAINIYSGNAYLPAGVQTIMTTNSTPYLPLGRYDGDFGNLILLDAHNQAVSATAGLTGDLAGDWKWEAFYTHGEGRVRLDSFNNVNNPRFYAAIDAVKDSNNNIVCRVTVTNPGLYPGCVPMNILGDGSPSAASIAYILGNTWWRALNQMDDVALNFNGKLFHTWAGPISFATGAEYRHNTLDEISSDDPNTVFNTTGLRGPFQSGTQNWTRNVVAATTGAQSVREMNLETVIPLLTDLPFAKTFEFNGAARYTEYSTSGSVKTWKLGLEWQPLEDVRLRATRSQDIRAPSLYELYQGKNLSITGFTDLHTQTGGFTNTSTQGNPGLVPEVARTDTAGIVYTPSWAPGFSLAIDYYTMSINNAIAAVGGNNTPPQQDCENSGGTSPLCALYIRPLPFSDRTAANYPSLIITQNLNIAQTSTRGVDVEFGYQHHAGPGMLNLRLLDSYQPVLYTRSLPSAALLNQAGASSGGPGSPAPQKQRITLNAAYAVGGLNVSTEIRYLSSLKPSPNPQLVYTDPDIPSFVYVDLALTYDVKIGDHTLTPFLTVDNLLDKQPPLFASTAFTGNPGFFYPVPTGYDIVGRYYTAGVRFRL